MPGGNRNGETLDSFIEPICKERAHVCVCVCVSLYLPHIDYLSPQLQGTVGGLRLGLKVEIRIGL